MYKIIWKEQYSIGIRGIDTQHKQLIVLMNILIETSQSEALTVSLLDNILSQLTHYTKYHFTYEEALFKKYNYSETEAHIKEHRKFINKLDEFKQKEPAEIGDEVLDYLNNWLINHIVKIDMKYAALFQKKED